MWLPYRTTPPLVGFPPRCPRRRRAVKAILGSLTAVTILLTGGDSPRHRRGAHAAVFTVGMNLALFFTNLFVFYTARHGLAAHGPHRDVVRAGYTALFVLVLAVLNKPPLFILLVVAYAGFLARRCCSVSVASSFVSSSCSLSPLRPSSRFAHLRWFWLTRGKASRFVRLCLCGGPAGFDRPCCFPLIHLGMQDSLQTLWRTFVRGDVPAPSGSAC